MPYIEVKDFDEVFRKLFCRLIGKNIQGFPGSAIREAGDEFDFRCQMGFVGHGFHIPCSFVQADNFREIIRFLGAEQFGNSGDIVFGNAVDTGNFFFGYLLFQVILDMVKKIPGDRQIWMEPVELFHKGQGTGFAEVSALDEV